MIDIHTHVLPGLDDGSGSLEESLWLGHALARQGVKLFAATPHFYATQESPRGLPPAAGACRAPAVSSLAPRVPSLPHGGGGALLRRHEPHPGAAPAHPGRHQPAPAGDALFPVEPADGGGSAGNPRAPGLQVLLAHVERYLPYQEPKVWEKLRQGKVWMQCNASFFLHWRTKPKALRMLRKGEIHMLGSDCHNKTTRPPRLGEAAEVIEKSLGQGTWRAFNRRALALLKSVSRP